MSMNFTWIVMSGFPPILFVRPEDKARASFVPRYFHSFLVTSFFRCLLKLDVVGMGDDTSEMEKQS